MEEDEGPSMAGDAPGRPVQSLAAEATSAGPACHSPGAQASPLAFCFSPSPRRPGFPEELPPT